MKYVLEYAKDKDTEELGFIVKGSKDRGGYNVASEGLLIAHDILEHARIEDIGTIGDELKALGGIWFVRGEYGDLRRDSRGSIYSPHENVASDVTNMARYILCGGSKLHCKVPEHIKPACCPVYSDFEAIIDIARKDIPKELEGEDYNRAAMQQYLNNALKLMVMGYNHAKKRFRPVGGQIAANNLFWRISEEVEKALKWAEFEGQQFSLSVSAAACKVYCEELYESEFA